MTVTLRHAAYGRDGLAASGRGVAHIAKQSYLLHDSIRRLEPRLATHGFLRVHRSALVNLVRVRELRRPTQRDWYLVLDDGTELPVSRRLRPEIQRQLGRLGEGP